MKFSKLRQLMLVSAIGLVVATLFSGCQLVTIDYLFVATSASTISAKHHRLSGRRDRNLRRRFGVRRDSYRRSTGLLRRHHACGPCHLSWHENLYVANQVDMNIVHFAVATNGVLTKKDSVSLATVPVAMTVSPDGNTLYVVSGTTTATLSAFRCLRALWAPSPTRSASPFRGSHPIPSCRPTSPFSRTEMQSTPPLMTCPPTILEASPPAPQAPAGCSDSPPAPVVH